jgi:hypothetical protein
MALARCPAHPPSAEYIDPFVRPVEPVGYPNRALLCGHKGCLEPALISLTENEAIAYHLGDREFRPPQDACGFRVR